MIMLMKINIAGLIFIIKILLVAAFYIPKIPHAHFIALPGSVKDISIYYLS